MAFPKYKTKAEIPENFQSEYYESDGEWVVKLPDLVKGPTQEDLDTVKGALDKEREARKASDKKAKEAEAAAKKAEEEAAGKKLGLTEQQIEDFKKDIRADLVEETAEEITGLKAKVEGLKGVDTENRELKLDSAIKALMVTRGVGVRGERAEALFTLASDEFDLTEDGKPKLTKHPGKTVEQFLSGDLKERFPEFYIGSKGGGGGQGGHIRSDGSKVVGTTADDIMKDPKGAINAARASKDA